MEQAAAAAGAPPEDPTAEQLEAMMEDLLAAYRGPAFQAELKALQRACLSSGGRLPLLAAMGPVVLKVQAPVLKKFGYPPSALGVDLMKHAVARRVAEGADRVEELANQARKELGIDAMPDRKATAEQVLARKVEETTARLALPGVKDELAEQCRDRIAKELEAGMLSSESAELLEHFLRSAEVTAPAVLSLIKMTKFGIGPAGLWVSNPPGEAPILESPSPEDFFRNHVMQNRPAVLRSVLSADLFPPLRDFRDMEFLQQRCGHRRVLVKSLAHDDQEGRPVFVSDPELKLPFKAFLDDVVAHEAALGSGEVPPKVPFYLGKVPLRKELPELAEAVEGAPSCPRRQFASCFGDLVPDGVFTYFGCGRNTTAVHFDAHENLMLCISGRKRLFLYPPSDARFLYPCNDFSRSAVVPFASLESMPADLQAKYSMVAQARPLEVYVEAGDILYLPSCWWHCVEGSLHQNMILNWWFALHPEKKALARGKPAAAAA